ncbi:MAG: preprotein translocase subunit YajC [Elusimicrobia bacterium]|nr:preprotein translocase subunit YajC [Candidatus Liberimonas magnetica]
MKTRFFLLISTILSFKASLFAQAAQSPQSALGSFFPLIVIFIIFYFLLIRPQQKKAKEHQAMLNALKKDDKVITSGGMYGVVSSVKGEIVELKIAEGVKVNMTKSSITTIITHDQEIVTPEIVK